jgi:hypothetical protein
MTFFLLLLGGIIVCLAGVSWSRRRHHAHNLQFLAEGSGFASHPQMAGAVALARRANLNPDQARPHYQFLVEAFGGPAVDAAASLLLAGTFENRFHGQTLEAALHQLSQEYPDPVIDAIVDRVLNDKSRLPPAGPPPQPPSPGSHGDGLPF